MKQGATWLACFVVALALGADMPAAAQGKGGGGGGGGNAGSAAGALYGDLYVIERDGAGVPVTRNVTYTDTEAGPVTVACVQPLAADCTKLRLWGEMGTLFNPELYDPCAVYTDDVIKIQEVKFGRESVSRAPATVLDKSYAEALKAINAATAGVGKCDLDLAAKLDPAGRLTLCLASETTPATYAWKTIDAPLENLGLYRAIMANGCFGKVTEEKVGEEGVRVVVTTALDPTGIWALRDAGQGHLVCGYPAGTPLPDNLAAAEKAEDVSRAGARSRRIRSAGRRTRPAGGSEPITPDRTAAGYKPGDGVTREDMLSGAVFIAAGADKTSPVTLDEIVNVNNYVGVNLWTYTRVQKQQVLTINYFPFTDAGGPGGWFGYRRGTDACVSPTYAGLLTDAGRRELHDRERGRLRTDAGRRRPELRRRAGLPRECPARSRVQGRSGNPAYSKTSINGCGGANWFTQAAEDARKTIWYLHNWRVPEIGY